MGLGYQNFGTQFSSGAFVDFFPTRQSDPMFLILYLLVTPFVLCGVWRLLMKQDEKCEKYEFERVS
jgi:hypothetical protein